MLKTSQKMNSLGRSFLLWWMMLEPIMKQMEMYRAGRTRMMPPMDLKSIMMQMVMMRYETEPPSIKFKNF